MVSDEQTFKSNVQIWGCYVDLVHVLHIFLGGVKMILVNIIFLSFMVALCIKTMSILIPMAIKELKKMEDIEY